MLTEPPILLLKSQKSTSHYGHLVPTRLWKVESVAKLYDPAKCEVGYRNGFTSLIWMQKKV